MRKTNDTVDNCRALAQTYDSNCSRIWFLLRVGQRELTNPVPQVPTRLPPIWGTGVGWVPGPRAGAPPGTKWPREKRNPAQAPLCPPTHNLLLACPIYMARRILFEPCSCSIHTTAIWRRLSITQSCVFSLPSHSRRPIPLMLFLHVSVCVCMSRTISSIRRREVQAQMKVMKISPHLCSKSRTS